MNRGVRVSLSSGDVFYIDAPLDRVARVLGGGRRALVRVGGRVVNPVQVTQLTVENVPSIETAELLEAERGSSEH